MMIKKQLFLVMSLVSILAFGQEGSAYDRRVGINTDSPRATLDIKERPLNMLPVGTPQGVLFPSFKTEERAKFVGVKEGTMIYNSDLKCLEIFINNVWKCLSVR